MTNIRGKEMVSLHQMEGPIIYHEKQPLDCPGRWRMNEGGVNCLSVTWIGAQDPLESLHEAFHQSGI